MAKRSKIKGSSFERKVAHMILTAANVALVSGRDLASGRGFTSKDCYRTPMSGGHPHAANGDLVISARLSKWFPFCVECKHRRTFRLDQLFDHNPAGAISNAQLTQFHSQAVASAKKAMLAFHPLIVIRGHGGRIFAFGPKGCLPSVYPNLRYIYNGRPWRAVLFSDLLRVCVDQEKRRQQWNEQKHG